VIEDARHRRMVRPCIRLMMPSLPRYLAIIRAALRCLSAQEGFTEETIDKLILATDEALANVIKHGYDSQPDGSIGVFLRPMIAGSRKGLDIVIVDRAKSIDPSAIRGRDLADIRPGGLGVHIIRSVMDKVQYRRRFGGGMLLRMVKYLDASRAGTVSGSTDEADNGTTRA
jgi:serine/threonine-protein kinase RsbW